MEEPLEQTISARQLGAAFSGCFLGAGYVSGREMWQFFGRFGPVGWLGLCLSIALLGGAGALLLLPACPPPAFQGGVGWLPSAMAFSAYNMFSAVAILAPLGRQVPPRCTPRGIGLGCTMLFMVAAPILLVLNHYPGAAETEFPMLTVVTAISPGLGIPYLLLLLIAMVVTAFSCFLAGMERLSAGTELHGRERVLRFFAVSLVAWGASLLGFGELISLIYPVFGAVSAVFLTGMAVHFCRVNWGNPNEKADGK